MSILDQLQESAIDVNVAFKKRDDVLLHVAQLAKTSKILKKIREEDIFQGLRAREELGTTGFGDGIAIPHCSFSGISDFVVGFCLVKTGADFFSMDGKPVHVVFFIIGPEEERNRHIQILSTISKILINPQNVTLFRKAQTPADVIQIVRSEGESGVAVQQAKERCLFHIIVQREEYFDQVMQILSADVQGEIAVFEGHNAGYYMHRMPLFSAYWREDAGGFTRVILAVADKAVCNDIIRRIYLISDDIDKKGGILIAAQDLVFAGGSLDY